MELGEVELRAEGESRGGCWVEPLWWKSRIVRGRGLFEICIVDSLANLLLFDLIWTSPAIVDGERREGGSHRAWKEKWRRIWGQAEWSTAGRKFWASIKVLLKWIWCVLFSNSEYEMLGGWPRLRSFLQPEWAPEFLQYAQKTVSVYHNVQSNPWSQSRHRSKPTLIKRSSKYRTLVPLNSCYGKQCQGHSIKNRELIGAIARIAITFNWEYPGVNKKFKAADLLLSLLGEVNVPQFRALWWSKQISDFSHNWSQLAVKLNVKVQISFTNNSGKQNISTWSSKNIGNDDTPPTSIRA